VSLLGFLKWGLKKTCYFLYGISSICPHNLMLISLEHNNFFLIRETSLLPQIRFSEWTLPMKYANYIHACVQTLLVADAQSRLRHAPISCVQNSTTSLILPTKTLVRTRYVQFTYFMGRVYCDD
jgi:hypothetical protein